MQYRCTSSVVGPKSLQVGITRTGITRGILLGFVLGFVLQAHVFRAQARGPQEKSSRVPEPTASQAVRFILHEGEAWQYLQGTQDLQGTWADLVHDTSIPAGTRLKVGPGFSGELSYADGTLLRLEPGTHLQLLADGLRLYTGSAWVRVTKRGRTFRMVTPSAIASVRGTIFAGEVPDAPGLGGATLLKVHHAFRPLLPLATPMPVDLVRRYLERFRDSVPEGILPVRFQVYEGTVVIVPLDENAYGRVLKAGDRITVTSRTVSPIRAIRDDSYARWNLPKPVRAPSGDPGKNPWFQTPIKILED